MNKPMFDANSNSVLMARSFLQNHSESLIFEIEYAANGETSRNKDGLLVLHGMASIKAVRMMQFFNAMVTLAEKGQYNPDDIRSGLSLIGREVLDSQQEIQHIQYQADHCEDVFREKNKLHEGIPLSDDQHREVERNRKLRLKEVELFEKDVSEMLSMQSDLLDITKGLGIHSRRNRGDEGQQRGLG